MSKGFAPIYILISLAVMATAVGVYLIQKTTVAPPKTVQPVVVSQPTPTPKPRVDEIANWKTYTNQKYGFSFKYPFVFNEDDKLKFAEKTYLLTLSNGGDDEIKANNLTVYVAKIVDYKLDDRPAAFHFYFDSERKRWLHKETNDSSEFVPKRTNNPIESYIYKTGDANGSSEYLLIPSYSNGYIIEIINSYDRGDSGSYRKGYYNITSDQIIATFKFLPDSPVSGDQTSVEGKFCGGIAANLPQNQCPSGYKCQLEGNYPDAGGKCVKK